MPPRNLLRFAVVSAMCSLGLGACTVGPDFVRPTTPWLAGYTTETHLAQTASADVDGGAAQRFIEARDIPGQW